MVTFLIGILSFILTSGSVFAASLEDDLRPYVSHGAVVAEMDGAPIVSLNENLSLIPASIQKIATALWAIEVLGEDYRFRTLFLQKDGSLYVKGNGDPFLVSEAVTHLAFLLKRVRV